MAPGRTLPYRALLLDLEGTLYEEEAVLPGAVEAVTRVRDAGMAVRFVTNTTRASRARLLERLRRMGFEASEQELFTAVSAAGSWCREEAKRTALPLLASEAWDDLKGIELRTCEQLVGDGSPAASRSTTSAVDAVLVGDLGAEWDYAKLNTAFRCLRGGATLVACQKNRFWSTGGTLSLDAGPFVAALEYAAATEAVVVGKPSPLFFRAALAELDIRPRDAVVLGDDAEIDVGGAIAAGLAGWLVKSGKYRPGDESRAAPWPECILESIVELPEALGIR